MRELERVKRGEAAATSSKLAPAPAASLRTPDERTPTTSVRRTTARTLTTGTTPKSLFAPADLLSASAQGGASTTTLSKRHPDAEEALREARRVGDALLKHEAKEIALIDTYAKELEKEEKDPFSGARELPCGEEAGKVRACYSANAADASACRDAVDDYKKCGRVALRKFVAREPAAA